MLPLRAFRDGATITLEPFRTGVFQVLRDLVVDRSALDRIVQAGGYVSVRAGSAPDASALPVGRATAARALDAAVCIGCGACVAACPNGAASLFVGAKLTHLGALPQGQPERRRRARALVAAADHEEFGGCWLHGECEAVCPERIDLFVIARTNQEGSLRDPRRVVAGRKRIRRGLIGPARPRPPAVAEAAAGRGGGAGGRDGRGGRRSPAPPRTTPRTAEGIAEGPRQCWPIGRSELRGGRGAPRGRLGGAPGNWTE